MPQFNADWFNSLVLLLAFLLFIVLLRTKRRSVWVNVALLVVSAVALSNIATLVGLRLFRGVVLSPLRMFDWELFVVMVLFIACFLGIPQTLLRQPGAEPERYTIRTHLWPSLLFCVIYTWHYVQFTSWINNIWFAMFTVVPIGLVGTLVFAMLLSSKDKPLVSSSQYRLALRFILSVLLLVYAIATPLFNDPQGDLVYGLAYETDEGMVLKEPMQLDSYFNLANYYRSLGDNETALTLYQESINRHPGSYDAYLHHADLLIQTGQYQAAIADLDIAASLTSTDTLPYYGRAVAYEALGDYHSAIQNLDQVIALYPDSRAAYLARAGFSIYAGEYEQALADADVLEEKWWDKFTPALFRSVAYMGQQDSKQAQLALVDFTKADERELHFERYYTNSIDWYRFADLDGHHVLNLSMRMGGISAVPLMHQLGYARHHFFSTESQSINFVDSLRKRFNSTIVTWEYLTPIIRQLASESSLQDASLIYTTLGSVHSSLNQPETALEYYERALDLMSQESHSDDKVELYYKLGRSNIQQGNIEDGIEYLSKALELDPNYINALFARAQVYYDIDRIDDALVDMQRVVQLDPEWADARLLLAHYSNLGGEYRSALRHLLAIEPDVNDRPMYHHCLGYAYVATGEYAQAIDAYEEAFRLAGTMSYSNRTAFYGQMVDELAQLEAREPDASAAIEDLWTMMRGAAAADLALGSVQADEISNPVFRFTATVPPTETQGFVYSVGSTGSMTLTGPITQSLWVQLAAVGPERIRPGSSDVFRIEAVLQRSPDSEGVSFPIVVYVDRAYTVQVRPNILNFEFSGETDPQALTRPLEIGEPVHWEWVLSPKSGYEGNQYVTYDIVVRDQDGNSPVKNIQPAAIKISVPTRYGIPAQILYPISGIGAAVGTFLALPVLNTLLSNWLKRRDKDEDQDKDDDDEDGERPQLIVVSRG